LKTKILTFGLAYYYQLGNPGFKGEYTSSPVHVNVRRAGSAAAKAGDEQSLQRQSIFEHWRNRLVAFYKRYNQDKLEEVEELLTKFIGREQALFAALEKKYGPEFTEKAEGGVNDVNSVKSSTYGSMALSDRGDVYQWGMLFEEILMEPTLVWSADSVLKGGVGVKQRAVYISCGRKHAALITDKGRLHTWGCGFDGALGHGSDETHYMRPREVRGLSKYTIYTVACGGSHTVAATEEGKIYAWGNNRNGQLGSAPTETKQVRYKPKSIKLREDFACAQVACGRQHSAILSVQGYLLTFGGGKYGRLGHGPSAIRENNWDQGVSKSVVYQPRVVKHGPRRTPLIVHQVACGDFHTVALDTRGDVYTFGKNADGQCGHGTPHNYVSPRAVESLRGCNTVAVAAGGDVSMALLEDGAVYTWGSSEGGSLGVEVSPGARGGEKDFYLDGGAAVSLPCHADGLQDWYVMDISCSGGHTVVLASETKRGLSGDMEAAGASPVRPSSLPRVFHSPYSREEISSAVATKRGEGHNNAPPSSDVVGGTMNGQTAPDPATVFSRARHGRYADVLSALKNGLPVDSRDTHDNTLLLIACQNGKKRIVKLCLRYGADLNAKNRAGNTALHFCFMYEHLELFDYLLGKGAGDEALNEDGQTCYDVGDSTDN
jgi:alpha-tubulin suppressor-like RCC1 family protein